MAKQVSVSLEKEHIKAVKDFGKRMGIKPFSTALQAMIVQFQAMSVQAVPVPASEGSNGTGATQ